jgi:D-alanyl-D-alanine carboxypeptidase/D-alanyl-D-alanine-endopeptidase (penicillin-binding protein 4)
VTHITGSVIGDESRYDTQRAVPTWPSRYISSGEAGPLSALDVNDGFSAFTPALVPAPQPAEQAAATFAGLLQAQGITITGPPGVGIAPAGAATVTQLSSPPLPQVLGEILRQSDNTGAELITKELGREANPATPTTAAGVAAIESDIIADGLPAAGLHMVDGSGLDRSDRVTCQLILAVLQRSGPNGAIGQGLPVAGKTGTLFQRMNGTPAAGRLRAKTGTLDGVSALSGFVLPASASASTSAASASVSAASSAASGADVTFSFINNAAPDDAIGEALGDRVGVLLAQFPEAPPITELEPLPAP